MPSFETILYSVEDHIATITLHRPERMNAWTLQGLLRRGRPFRRQPDLRRRQAGQGHARAA